MYTLVSAIAERFDGDSRWSEAAIGELSLPQIYTTYRNVKAVLSNNYLDHLVALDLADIRAQYGSGVLTFNELLQSLGNEALPTTTVLPQLKTRYAQYADAFRAGYKVQPVHPVWAPDAESPPADRTWLHLTRERTDYAKFGRSCMVSVNGFWHFIEVGDEGVYVKEGNASSVISRLNTIGVYDFEQLGQLQYIALTPEQIYTQSGVAGQQLRHRAYIDLGQDVSEKMVLLVIGGYLHVMDTRVFWRTGPSTLAVSMENLPLLERYHESRQALDFSGLPFERTSRNATQVSVDNFMSNDNLRAYLSMAQSFAVVLECPNIFVERQPVHTTRIPGGFISYEKPQWPLISGYGMSPNYWSTYEDRQWSLTCCNGYLSDNPLFHTVDAMQQQGISDSRVPEFRHRYAQASFLKIGRDI